VFQRDVVPVAFRRDRHVEGLNRVEHVVSRLGHRGEGRVVLMILGQLSVVQRFLVRRLLVPRFFHLRHL
jgi:hypothetical protein